jgi:hypothetical protein
MMARHNESLTDKFQLTIQRATIEQIRLMISTSASTPGKQTQP